IRLAWIDPPAVQVFAPNTHARPSVMVTEFHVIRVTFAPAKAQAPLLPDPDAALARLLPPRSASSRLPGGTLRMSRLGAAPTKSS
ncbi:MAG TPA: hypothetical protein VGD36_19125, partial [Xanthobacteraceae bacterium]